MHVGDFQRNGPDFDLSFFSGTIIPVPRDVALLIRHAIRSGQVILPVQIRDQDGTILCSIYQAGKGIPRWNIMVDGTEYSIHPDQLSNVISEGQRKGLIHQYQYSPVSSLVKGQQTLRMV